MWVLAFMSFGYATKEFEVTAERLGTYRPEEHIDNPKDYADNVDARQYDPRLRPPVMHQELAIDPNTGMKNYIANEYGGWATSAGYVKFSLARSIHFGRVYTSGRQGRGNEADLCEALRCLGQGLHCLEDFGAHTNYVELALRELGFSNVFPYCGQASAISILGKRVFPLVTGTFGGVDFLHSVLGEATDHITQTSTSELDEMNNALGSASTSANAGGRHPEQKVSGLTSLLSKIPGTSELCQEAINLQAASDAQSAQNVTGGHRGFDSGYGTDRAPHNQPQFPGPPGSFGAPPGPGIPGMNPSFDPQATVAKIYPILEFRDKVVRAISSVVSKIPGLESLIEKITERVTLFIMGLLAPYIQPIILAASEQLKQGSSSVVDASGKHQYEPWTDPYCTDPTHSLLSKDHFSNILNQPAGQVAAEILKYVAPRIVYAWEHPDVAEQQILDDVIRVFHHPAIRDNNLEVHRKMFGAVERWVHGRSDRGASLNDILSSDSVKAGRNHSTYGGAHGHTVASYGAPRTAFPEPPTSYEAFGAGPPPGPPSAHQAFDYAPQDPAAYSSAYQSGYQDSPYRHQGPAGAYDQLDPQPPYGPQSSGYDGNWDRTRVQGAYAPDTYAQQQQLQQQQQSYGPQPPYGQNAPF